MIVGTPASKRGPMYTLTDVTKTYRKGHQSITAVNDLDLTIADGEWLAVQGRTGSGKTTLLQLLGALDHPSSGVISFDGRDLARLPETDLTDVRAGSIGFVFQTFNLIPTLSAQENVEVALIPQPLSAAARCQRATEALASVGLAQRASHLPSEMSGGQQQRVGIARALAKQPRVLLADEPTGNLDTDTRDEIMALLEELWRDRGLTLVLVTHDAYLARRAQRVATMRDGRLSIGLDPATGTDGAEDD
jgi:putative ABC transport system ATP-binding protein